MGDFANYFVSVCPELSEKEGLGNEVWWMEWRSPCGRRVYFLMWLDGSYLGDCRHSGMTGESNGTSDWNGCGWVVAAAEGVGAAGFWGFLFSFIYGFGS